MEIRYLRLIKAIVEEGGITKATRRLHLTQSALSRQLQEAEYQLGTKIFLRVNRKLIPTEAGEKLLLLAYEILDRIEETERSIRELVNGESGEIRISTECYTSYNWLPSIMRQFKLLYPNVRPRIVMESTHRPLLKLLEGELDLAVTSDPVEDRHIRYIKLFRDEIYAVVPENHKLADRKYLTAEDFADQTLLIHSLPMETVSVHRFLLAPARISPEDIIVLPLTEAIIEMVRAGMGITTMSGWALNPYLKSGDLKKLPLGPKGLKRDNFAALLNSDDHPGYLEHFIEFMRREIAESVQTEPA